MEQWRDVTGWPYQVSNQGRVRRSRKAWATRPVRTLAGERTKQGYHRVLLQSKGVRQKFMTHRLVAEAFLQGDLIRTYINHLNGIKDDNRAENLEWCTRSENQKHAFAMGLQPLGWKLTWEKVREIRSKEGTATQKELAREFGVTQGMISKIHRQETWRE